MNLDLANDLSWKSGTFEGAELHSLILGLETSFRDKIIWIEEMQKIQERMDQNRLKRLGAATEPKIP